MEFNTFTWIFLVAIVSFVVTMFWLNLRQKQSIARAFAQVPHEFTQQISLKSHQKAGNYTRAKLQFNQWELLFSAGILLALSLGGGLEWLDGLWRVQTHNILHVGAGFLISLMLASALIDLPIKLYRTFVIEKKFGFNQTTQRTFWLDFVKEIGLSLVIGLPIIYAILALMNAMGDFWWLYVWGMLVSFSLLMFWLYPTYIAPIFNKFEPLDNPQLKAKISDLLTRTGFALKTSKKSDGVFVMDGSKRSSHGNAYFTGIGKNKRIVFFDTLLKGMSDAEVEAILAHELGHFHHKHIRKHMLSSFAIMLASLALLGYLINQPWFFNGLGVSTPSNYIALALFTLALPVFSFFISPINNFLSRKHEFEADNFAAKHTSAQDLISALVKLYRDNAATLTPDVWYSAFHDSHPSASIRIQQLHSHSIYQDKK